MAERDATGDNSGPAGTRRTAPLRVLHLFKSMQIGGIERSTIMIANSLQGSLAWTGIIAARGVFDHGTLVHPNVHLLLLNEGTRYKVDVIAVLRTLITAIRENKITIVHYHHRVFISYIYIIRLLCPSVKIVYTHHSVYGDALTRFITADAVVAPSTAAASEIGHCLKQDVTVIPHGVEPAPEFRHDPTAERKRIGYVGRFTREKGLHTLVRAVHRLLSADPSYMLVLRGEGAEEEAIRNFISSEGMEGHALIEPPTPCIDEVYHGIDILVLPSLSLEGYGMALVEAMARKIPVIGTRVGGIVDIITHEDNGMLVAPGNDDELAAAIAKLSTDAEVYRTLSERGYKYVCEHADVHRAARQYVAVYERLLTAVAEPDPSHVTIVIAGCRITFASYEERIRMLDEALTRREACVTIGYANAHSIVSADKDGLLKVALGRMSIVFGDGVGIFVAASLRERTSLRGQRHQNATDYMYAMLDDANAKGMKVFFLGGTAQVQDACAQRMRTEYPNVVLAGTRGGFFEPDDRDVIAEIVAASPDMLVVGMGHPRQERWIDRYASELHVPVIIAVGGFFDFFSGTTLRAPTLVRLLHLEWLFRLLQEPGRLWKRYIIGIPQFISILVRERKPW